MKEKEMDEFKSYPQPVDISKGDFGGKEHQLEAEQFIPGKFASRTIVETEEDSDADGIVNDLSHRLKGVP